jgi:DNA-binding GntR family transcriptional regulator
MRRDLPAYFELNQQIHQAIVSAARNHMLEATYLNYSNRIRRMRYSANRETHKDRWGEAMREHELILDALRRRDGRELSEILFNHLQNKRAAAMLVRQETSSEV